VVAWLGGLDGAVRQPVASLITLAAWWLPTLVTAMVPLLLAWAAPFRGDAVALVAALQLSLIVRTGCRIALLAAFAPTVGPPLSDG
jgi:hypothetical protein